MSQQIRIVELYDPKKVAAALPLAKLVYNGGPLITSVNKISIFWGSSWLNVSEKELASKLKDFLTYIVDSPLIDQLDEYSVESYKINRGKHSGSVFIDGDVPKQLSDEQLQKMIKSKIEDGTLPKQDENSPYFTFLPSGLTLSKGSEASCSVFCGYHDAIDYSVFYAAIPYPDCAGCLGNLEPFDAMTSISSHELCEAITDPIVGNGWYDNTYGEIGDICAWKTKKLDKYTVQLEWSNKLKNCM